jgi:hypothetical protein
MNVFKTLNKINVNEHTESKGGLTYLSWSWAWAEVKKAYPEATYYIHENEDGWNYHHDGKTAWVKTSVVIEGLEHVEYLPILQGNKSIPLDKITSFNVNTAIQRSITKNCARHGLGLYIYAGEDLPDIPVFEKEGALDDYVQQISESFGESNYHEAKKLYRECTSRQQAEVWKALDQQAKMFVKEALSVKEDVI